MSVVNIMNATLPRSTKSISLSEGLNMLYSAYITRKMLYSSPFCLTIFFEISVTRGVSHTHFSLAP